MFKRVRGTRRVLFSLFMALSFLLLNPVLSFGDKKAEEEKKPERLIEMAVEYPVVVVAPKEEVSMDIIL